MSSLKEVDMIPVQAIKETTKGDMKQLLPINDQSNTTQTNNNSRPSSVQSLKTTTRQISYITPQNLRSFHYFKFFQGKLIPAQLFIINHKTISSSSKATHYNNIINQLTQYKIPFVSTIKQALQYGYFNQQNCRYRVVIDIENLLQLIKHPRQISLIQQITVFNSGDSNNVSYRYQQFLECKRIIQGQQKCTKISKMLQSLQGYIDSMKPYVKYYKRSISQLSSTQQQSISEKFLKPMLPAYFSSHELSQKTLYRAKLWAAVQSTRHLNHYQITKSICRYKHFIQRLKSTITSRNLQLNDKQAFAMYIDIERQQKGYLNTQQNMVKLLALYKKESFYYNILNSMLRVCRRISDFEPISLPYGETYRSIKYFYDKFIKENNYKRQKMNLYRGCRLQDIQKMSIGGYYEMLGFLSCSKNIKVVQKQFLSHEDSCMMIINIKQRQIVVNRLCYDHGLIDYEWLQEYKQLMKTIISKDLQYEQQVMLNSFSLLRLVDRRKQQINGKQRWVVECDLVAIDELRQRMQQLRRSLSSNNPSALMTTTTLTTKLIYSSSACPSSIISTSKTASIQQQQKHNNKNNSQFQQQSQLRQIQRALKNLQYFQQQMIKIKDMGDLYGQFGEIDNQQNYYRQVLMEQYQNVISSQKFNYLNNNNNGNKNQNNNNNCLSNQTKRQIQFKYAQSMMKCGKLQLAYNWLIGQSDLLQLGYSNKLNNNKQHNKTHKSIKTPYLNLSNYNGNQQQQIKTILRQNDDQVSLRESLLYRIEELNKKDNIIMNNKSSNNNNNKHNHFQYYQNKYLIASHTYQLSQSHYNSNNIQQTIQLLNKTKQLIKQCHSSNILINSKLSSHQQRKTQGCFDFVNVVSKLFGINNNSIDERKNQRDMVQKKLSQQKINKINKQLIQLQIKVNGLLIKCYKETEGNNETNRNNIKQISSKRNSKKIQQLVQQTLHIITIYNQNYPEYTKNNHYNLKQTNIQLLLIQASIKLQNNLYQQAQEIINVLQTTKNEIERSNPNDQRLPKLYHQLANIQSQQLLTTLSLPCDKYTLTINNNSNTSSKSSSFILTQQQKAYRQSQFIKHQYKLTNTNTVFNKQLYSQKVNAIENNYNKSLQMMQVNGQQNTVKYIKVQNQLGYFYRDHNMLLQSDSMANRVTQSILTGTHTQGVLAHILLAKNHVSRGEHKLAQQQLLLAEDILHNAIIKATLIVRKSNNQQEYQSEYKHSQMYFEIEILRVIIYNAVGEYNKALKKLGQVESLFGESGESAGSVSGSNGDSNVSVSNGDSNQGARSKQLSNNNNNNNNTTKRLSNMMLINQAKATMLAMGYKTLPKQMLLIQWQQYLTKSIQYAVQYLGEQHTRIGDYYCSLIKYMLNEVTVNIHRSINAQSMNSISLYIQKAVEIYSRLAFDHPLNCNLFYIFYLVGDKRRELSIMGNNNNSNNNSNSNNKSNKINNTNNNTPSQISPVIDTLRYCIKLTTYRYKQHVHINLIKTIYQQFRFYFSLIQSQGGVKQIKQTIMMINRNSSSSNNSNANNKYTKQKCFYCQQTLRIGNELLTILSKNHSLMKFVSQVQQLKEDHKVRQDFIHHSKMADQKVGIKLFVDEKLFQLKDTNTNNVNVN